MILDDLRSFLKERQVRYQETPIQIGTQVRCTTGEVFNVYDSGKVRVGGALTPLAEEVKAWSGGISQLSPKAAVGTWRRAEEFAEAARLVSDQGDMFYEPMVAYFLFGHAIELAIKSFLIGESVPEDELRRLGHNLEACLDRARKCGGFKVHLSEDDCDTIAGLNRYYRGKEFEYLYLGYASFPMLEAVQGTCRRMLEQTKPLADRAAARATAQEA